LRLLAKMFTPEEARLASTMRLTPEPAAAVAARANVTEETALDLLNAMAASGSSAWPLPTAGRRSR
jgi:hypothetical protein